MGAYPPPSRCAMTARRSGALFRTQVIFFLGKIELITLYAYACYVRRSMDIKKTQPEQSKDNSPNVNAKKRKHDKLNAKRPFDECMKALAKKPKSPAEAKARIRRGIYKGETDKNGRAHGKGTMKYKCKCTYTGEFKDGKKNGRGINEYCNGDVCEVGYKENKPHGGFRLRKTLGSIKVIIRGEFKDGKIAGPVNILFPTGGLYRGETKNWKPHGRGAMIYPDGDVYSGEWMDGKQHGKGKLIRNDDEVLMGRWKNGLMCLSRARVASVDVRA